MMEHDAEDPGIDRPAPPPVPGGRRDFLRVGLGLAAGLAIRRVPGARAGPRVPRIPTRPLTEDDLRTRPDRAG